MTWTIKAYAPALRLAVLAACCVCTGVSVGLAPGGGANRPHVGPPATSIATAAWSEKAQGNPLAAVPLGSLRATRERPLFSVSRRPPPAIAVTTKAPVTAVAARAAPPQAPAVTLVGVIKGEDMAMGIFVDDHDRSAIRARVGESVRGWIVSDVEGRTVTLRRAGTPVKLELRAGAAATAKPTDPSAPLRGMPVGPITPFAAASRKAG